MFADVNNVRLYYEVTGAGPALMLIHGNGENHSIFDKLTAALKDKFTVYMIDSRGHGQSSKIDVFHYHDMAEDCAQFIKLLKLNKPALYGFSDGGIIGLILASKYPGLLGSLIASGANTAPSTIRRQYYLLFKIMYLFNRSPLFKLMLTEPDITAEDLKRIKVPVLITAGSRDMVKESDTRFIAASIPNSQMKIFSSENHMSYITGSDFMARHIIEFLA